MILKSDTKGVQKTGRGDCDLRSWSPRQERLLEPKAGATLSDDPHRRIGEKALTLIEI